MVSNKKRINIFLCSFFLLSVFNYHLFCQVINAQYSTQNNFFDNIDSILQGDNNTIFGFYEKTLFKFKDEEITYYTSPKDITDISLSLDENLIYLTTQDQNLLSLNLSTGKFSVLKSKKDLRFYSINKVGDKFINYGASSLYTLMSISSKGDSLSKAKAFYTYHLEGNLEISTVNKDDSLRVDLRIQEEQGKLYAFEGMDIYNNKPRLKGVYEIYRDSISILKFKPLKNRIITAITTSKKTGITLLASRDSLFSIKEDSIINKAKVPFDRLKIKDQVIYRMNYLNEDNIVFMSHKRLTYNVDLFIYNLKSNNVTTIRELLNLTSENITGYIVDKGKNIWVSTNGDGLFKLINIEYNYLESNLFYGQNVKKIGKVSNSNFLVLFKRSINYLNNSLKVYKQTRMASNADDFVTLPDKRVFVLYEDGNYILTDEEIRQKFNNSKSLEDFEFLYGLNLSLLDDILIYENQDAIWLYNISKNALKKITKPNHLIFNNVFKNYNYIHLLTTDRTYTIDVKKNHFVTHALNDFKISGIAKFKKNYILHNIQTKQLQLVDENYNVIKWKDFNYNVKKIFVDKDYLIWILTDNDIFVYDATLTMYRKEIKNHGNNAKQIYPEKINDMCNLNDSILLYATNNGLKILNKKKFLKQNINEKEFSLIKKNDSVYLHTNNTLALINNINYSVNNSEWFLLTNFNLPKNKFSHGDNNVRLKYYTGNSNWEEINLDVFNYQKKWYKRKYLPETFGLTIMFLLGFIFFNERGKRIARKKKVQSLISIKSELEHKIKDIQKSYADDLHDNFGNRLSSIKTSKSILKELQSRNDFNSPNFDRFLQNIDHSVTELLADVKDIIWANSETNNTAIKLNERLKIIVEKFNNRQTNIEGIFKSSIDQNITFPIYWNRQIILILKEILNNAIKHSKASVLEIDFKIKKSKLKLRYKDNGVGFEMDNLKRISGLENLKKRTLIISGTIEINSSLNNGTEIRIDTNLENV